ncbi:MAG: flagellar hook-basal body complex protein, partial [Planctomycetota bacterium]
MGLTSALNTALNGLSLNETAIDVLGNNIANAGTNGFKSSEVLFESQLARTLSVGSRSTATNGGTNPRQIGLGASVSTIRKNFSQGSVTNSTSPSDLAIQGDGFFVLAAGEDRLYSRAGNFSLNSSNFLVNAQGFFVQGYGINEDNTVNTTGELQNIQINLGTDLEAQATTLVEIEGSILPTGTVGTRGTVSSTAQLFSDAVATGGAATAATNLVNVEISDGGGGFTNLFTAGTTLTFQPSKGGR